MQNHNKLIKNCLNNDRKAQRAFYEQYFKYMMSICYRYEQNQQDAVALMNQAFLKVMTHLAQYNPEKPIFPWLKRITINTCIDHVRKKKSTYGNTIFLDDDHWLEAEEATTIDEADTEELVYEDYIKMLQNLEEPTKTIFNLYAIDELSHREIATQLEISERTSKRYLQKARNALQKMIAEKKLVMKGA